MKGCMETQAYLSGEGAYRAVSGCVRISPFGNGSVVQAHVRGLPCPSAFYGFFIELCGRRCPLPPLLSCCGEALMSVYVCSFRPEDTICGRIVLTGDPCARNCAPIACGCIVEVVTPGCRPMDPRPLFAAPIRW